LEASCENEIGGRAIDFGKKYGLLAHVTLYIPGANRCLTKKSKPTHKRAADVADIPDKLS
jgi:hypothetical protein